MIRPVKTHCRRGHDISVAGCGSNGRCLACRREQRRKAYPGIPRRKGHSGSLKAAARRAGEETDESSRIIAARLGLVSKNAVIGLAARNNWKPRGHIGRASGLFGRCADLEIRMDAVMAETQPALDARIKAGAQP